MKDTREYIKYSMITLVIICIGVGFSFAYYSANINVTNSVSVSGNTVITEPIDIVLIDDEGGFINFNYALIPINIESNFIATCGAGKENCLYESVGGEVNAYFNETRFTLENPNSDAVDVDLFFAIETISDNWRSPYLKYDVYSLTTNGDSYSYEFITNGDFEDALSYTDKEFLSNIDLGSHISNLYSIIFWIDEPNVESGDPAIDQSGMLNGSLRTTIKAEALVHQPNQE